MSSHPAARCALIMLLCLLAAVSGAAQDEAPSVLAPLSDGSVLEIGDRRLDPAVPSPSEFLGYPLGSRFTRYERILDYFEALAAASDRVALERYGTTYEDRPLVLLAVGRPDRIARLDDVRRRHLELAEPAGLRQEELSRRLADEPVVVWLGYGIHGNESSSAEAAMATAYLVAAGQEEVAAWLEEMVVLIDPLSNPDGRERYVTGFEQRRGRVPDADPDAAEHWEPWPGGRQNHYLIDLNRDWAWASQRETRERLNAYRRWEPQVYVDLHEMSRRSTYFFPPSAEPVHARITAPVISWLEEFGRGNARAFDQRGFLFYKAESFDLFYPGYGDSYPALRGAVGMTYEMAGGGRAGQTVRLSDGRMLTLADRVARHLTASMATLETAAANANALLRDFVQSRRPELQGPASTFLWSPLQGEAAPLAELLSFHGIEVRQLGETRELAAVRLDDGGTRRLTGFPAGTYAVSTRQPLGRLAATLLEREAILPEPFLERQRERQSEGLPAEFYDITGWSLPLAFNLEVWEVAGEPAGLAAAVPAPGRIEGAGDLGVLLPPQGLTGFRLISRILQAGGLVRQALEPFEVDGRSFPAGTFFLVRRENSEELDRWLAEAVETGAVVHRVGSSFTEAGISLGSDRMRVIDRPRVALIGGTGVSPTSFGSLWHLLDQGIELALTRLDLDRLEDVALSGYDVLILPEGSGLGDRLGEGGSERLARWVKEGGTLVAVGDTIEWLREAELTAVVDWQEPEEEPDGGRGGDPETAIYTPGAVVATRLRTTHPIAAGIASPPPVLVTGSLVLVPTGRPEQDVLTAAPEEPVLSGFAWPEATERLAGSLLTSVERQGDGQVVLFAQDPAFRLFWRGTMPLFLNAVMFGPSWLDD